MAFGEWNSQTFLENRGSRSEPCEPRDDALSNVIEFSAERLGLAAHRARLTNDLLLNLDHAGCVRMSAQPS